MQRVAIGGNVELSRRAAIDATWERVPEPAEEVTNKPFGVRRFCYCARRNNKTYGTLVSVGREQQAATIGDLFVCGPWGRDSRICARVGEALAERSSNNVCVVDANLYYPSLHRQFGLPNICGLEDTVFGERPIRQIAQQLSPANLWMVSAGRRQVEPHALLSSARLRERLVQLKNDFPYVLIEAPPVGINGTASLLGPLADGVVLVIDAHSTRREVARSAKASLERANVRLFGAVLNDRTFPIPEAIYRNI